MAAQVEVQTGEVGRAGVGGLIHLSPLTDSSNKSLIDSPSCTQGSLIITSDPSKPTPGPKPRLTPKPFAVEKTPTIRPILAPKPTTKPRPEPTRPASYKPDPPNTPKPQQPNQSKPRPVSANPNRPAPTSFKPSPKLNTGQTSKPVAQPFKPAPPIPLGDPSKPTPPQPADRVKPGTAGSSYLSSVNKASAAEWSGTTKKEQEKSKVAPSHHPGGVPMTRAKSMGFLSEIRQEKEEEQKPETPVVLRPQPRGSKSRPVSAIFLPSPTKTESLTPALLRATRRPLSADLTSKFESIGLSLHHKPPKVSVKENTPEEKTLPVMRETEKGLRGHTVVPLRAESVASPSVSHRGKDEKKKESVRDKDEENSGASIKRRISLFLDSSASSPGSGDPGQTSEPHPSAQQVPETEALLGVKQRIKQLTEDTPPTLSPTEKATLKPRPLPPDLTKRFTSERSTDLGSPSLSEATDSYESDKVLQRKVEDVANNLGDQRKLENGKEHQEQLSCTSSKWMTGGSVEGQMVDGTSKNSGASSGVQTVRASLFENVVERHSVLVLEEDQPESKGKGVLRSLSLKQGDAEDEGTMVTATYKAPVSPSSPMKVMHSFDTVQAVEESTAVSESVSPAQLEEKAMTLRSRRSEGNRTARPELPVESSSPLRGEPVVALMQEQQPRYLRVGALQKWKTADLEQETGIESDRSTGPEKEREMPFETERAEHRWVESEEAAAPKRLKMLEAGEQSRPKATYFALTGQIQEPVSTRDAAGDGGDKAAPFDFSVSTGPRDTEGRIDSFRRNPSLDEALGKCTPSQNRGAELMERASTWDRQVTEEQMEVEKQGDFLSENERQKVKSKDLDKQRQLELEMQDLEFARMKERERQREFERKRQKDLERERQALEARQRELDRIKQLELEKEKLESERVRQRQLEKDKQHELERQQELERESQRVLERQRQQELDKERKLLEIQKERKLVEDLERVKEMERRQLLEFERQKQSERDRQQIIELEKQRLRERMEREATERMRQMAIQHEVDRLKELERERQRGLEKERLKQQERQRELERQRKRDLDRERQKQLDFERKEMENQRERELEKEKWKKEELERIKEMERRQLLEFENQRQVEKDRQRVMELEKQRLREKMEREEAEKMRQIARQQEAERQRLKEKQRREEKQKLAQDSSPHVLRYGQFSEDSSHLSDPAMRWKQPSSRPDEPYKPAILDIDSFTSQTQPSPSKEVFPLAINQGTGNGARSQVVPESIMPLPSTAGVPSPQDPWELKHPEMSVDGPIAGPEPPRKPVNKPSLEQLLRRHEERVLAPERRWSGMPNELVQFARAPSKDGIPTSSPGRISSSISMEQMQFPGEPEPQGHRADIRGHRRSQGSQELNRMRSRSVSRRPAPSESTLEGSLSRMRSRSAHREKDHHNWVQQKQNIGEEEVKDTDTLVQETDSQYGTWETGLRSEDSLTPATPSSDSNLSPSPRKSTPPHTPGDHVQSLEFDTPDSLSPLSPFDSQPLPFPEAPTTLLDSSALRSRVQLAKKRAPRSRPSRAALQSSPPGIQPEGEQGGTEDWRYRDSTEEKVERKQEDSDSEEQVRGMDPRSAAASQPQRIALFPGMDPTALKAQLKKRGDSDNQIDGPAPSSSQLSRSPKSPFLPQAARVLPPSGGKENGEEDSPQWLRDLKSKKRLSQYENIS